MDFKLDNLNLGLNEKNKKLFYDMVEANQINPNTDEENKNIDTFKMYNDFLLEKQAIIEIISEICDYSLHLCGKKIDNSKTLKNINKISDLINFKNRVIMILEHYQEQPGLIDPILSAIVSDIMNNSIVVIETLLFTEKEYNQEILTCLKCLYQIIYILCKIRGIQTVIKFFSSEVVVFEPVITFLLSLNPQDTENCDMIYVLILWTSILGLIPFDVETIDSKGIIIKELPKYFKKVLDSSGNIRDITSYALSKFITRPDIIKKGLLKDILEFFVEYLQNDEKNVNIFMDIGILSSLYEIFKNGIPVDLKIYVKYIVEKIISYKFPDYILTGGTVRRYFTKLTQRIGLVILKPKFQKWRYSFNLKNLLQKDAIKTQNLEELKNEQDDTIDELDYNLDYEILEILIDKILNSLTDREYIVRWSSAKGIGRLCERLTKNMVDDILENIFNLFDDEENEFSWQGGILAIAELCKRGMILPDKLEKIMFFLEKALIFEVNKGTFCSGSNVRDSACYLAWALARAYSKEVVNNYISRLAQRLILVMLFDKEVNCRRAASAAFQEHVGRQGYFPYGIEIITEADYFTLGNRSNCFLNISTFVAQYPEYCRSILDYISENRLNHVEENIRILSAETLGLLVPFDSEYFVDKIIPYLLNTCFSNNLFTRQGCILGLGYILVGLKGKWDFETKSKRIRKKVLEGMNAVETKILEDSEYRKNFEEIFNKIKFLNNLEKILSTKENFINILNLPMNLDEKKLYKGKGGEIMRSAVNNYIRLICEADILLEEKIILDYFDFLLDNLKHPNLDIQKDACGALKLLMEKIEEKINNQNFKDEILKRVKEILKNSTSDESIYINRGFTMSFSCFSKILINENIHEILNILFTNCQLKLNKSENNNNIPEQNKTLGNIPNNDINDYETRRISTEVISDIAVKLSCYNIEMFSKNIEKIFEKIFDGLKDYQIDKKLGDVGSKIRKSSMRSLTNLLILCFEKINFNEIFSVLFKKYVIPYLCGLLKQISEKLNKIRQTAGESLQNFFYCLSLKENEYINDKIKISNMEPLDFLLNCIPNFFEFKQIFLEDVKFNEFNQITNIDWLEPGYSFKKIVKFLLTECYSFSVFEGLIISIGGLTEDVQRLSLQAIDNLSKELIHKIYSHILYMLKHNEKDDRVIEPLFNTLAHLLTKSYFIDLKYLEYTDFIHKSLSKENFQSKNIHKILASVDIYYNFLFFEKEEKVNLYKRSLKSLLILMTHKYPVVRKKAAEKVFLFLSVEDPTNLGITEDECEKISLILCDTNWTEGISVIRDVRNEIAEFFKVNLDNIIIEKK